MDIVHYNPYASTLSLHTLSETQLAAADAVSRSPPSVWLIQTSFPRATARRGSTTSFAQQSSPHPSTKSGGATTAAPGQDKEVLPVYARFLPKRDFDDAESWALVFDSDSESKHLVVPTIKLGMEVQVINEDPSCRTKTFTGVVSSIRGIYPSFIRFRVVKQTDTEATSSLDLFVPSTYADCPWWVPAFRFIARLFFHDPVIPPRTYHIPVNRDDPALDSEPALTLACSASAAAATA